MKITLGEGKEAWAKMLANVDRSYDWGLEGCDVKTKRETDPCPDGHWVKIFKSVPEALKAHLIKHGYRMNFDGLPMDRDDGGKQQPWEKGPWRSRF